jgi:hypothetical protein
MDVGMDQGVAGLAEIPPGPALGAALARIDPTRLCGDHRVEVLCAQHRQLAHEQARMLAALVHVGRATPGVGLCAAVSSWAAGEVAAALCWTARAADRELEFAETVVSGLPLVYAALLAGILDRDKARVFAELLVDLTPEQVERICRHLVSRAGGWTTGQLRARLLRDILDIDPDYASRRYRRAIRGRDVIGYLNAEGTITITGSGLPADQAAIALERVDVLARTIRRAGHPASLRRIRADVFLGLLDGSLHQLTESQIVTVLLTHPRPEDTPTNHTPQPGHPRRAGQPTESDQTGEPDLVDESGETDEPYRAGEASQTGEPDPAHHIDEPGEHDKISEHAGIGECGGIGRVGTTLGDAVAEVAGEPGHAHPTEPLPTPPVGPLPTPPTRALSTSPVGSVPAPPVEPSPVEWSSAVPTALRGPRAGVEIRVGLATLLGWDQRCGEVAGLGPVLPEEARALVAGQLQGATWRFAVTDEEGRLVLAGVTRRRPALPAAQCGSCRGGVVELHLTATTLAQLAADPGRCGGWVRVITDIAAQYARKDAILAGLDHRPYDRFAHPALARHIEVRDRTCCHPGCRRPAQRCHKDHTRDHAGGGTTTGENIGPLCVLHHSFKTKGWWRLSQPAPGWFRWVSPLGRTYRTRGELIDPPSIPPHPRPGHPGTDHEVTDSAAPDNTDGSILYWPAPYTPPASHPGSRPERTAALLSAQRAPDPTHHPTEPPKD